MNEVRYCWSNDKMWEFHPQYKNNEFYGFLAKNEEECSFTSRK